VITKVDIAMTDLKVGGVLERERIRTAFRAASTAMQLLQQEVSSGSGIEMGFGMGIPEECQERECEF
jgi:hypothetical protein